VIVNREQLLKQLEAVTPGLSPKAIIEQSDCFVFRKQKVITFNDEIACRVATKVDFEGAVPADPLLKLLRKLQETELDMEVGEGGLKIRGKGRRAVVQLHQEIVLPVETIDRPSEWTPVGKNLLEALGMAIHCCSKDESKFVLTCVHVHPKWVESSDDVQILRYKTKTGISQATLVRGASVKYVVGMDVTELSESESWIHFKGADGLIISCRRFKMDYPDTSAFIEQRGKKVKLPDGLDEAVEKAEIFSAQNEMDNFVSVQLSQDLLRLEGRGASGWYRESRKISYSSEPLKFFIDPRLLREIRQRSDECEVAKGLLRVEGGSFVYATCTSEATD